MFVKAAEKTKQNKKQKKKNENTEIWGKKSVLSIINNKKSQGKQ